MLEPSYFYDLVSGRRRGIVATGMRLGLRAAEALYTTGVQFRNHRYDAQRSEITPVAVPVVSVGNLTLGGTGKTPMVKWIARHLRARDLRVAILSRGYGAAEGGKNDEALELEQSLPDVPHLQSPDRVTIAQAAIEELDSQVLVLDDGFQHRRLARDLDIVLLDATQPFGFDHVFPRGTLREPARNLQRAGVVCLSRANLVAAEEREAIRQRAKNLAPDAAWCEVAHTPATLLNSSGIQQPLESLNGAKVFAFCGIGNPQAFRKTLQAAGAQLVGWRELPDHHAFTADDVQQIATAAQDSGAEMVVCTQKDMVKLRIPVLKKLPLWSVVVEIEFLSGEGAMIAALDQLPITPASDNEADDK